MDALERQMLDMERWFMSWLHSPWFAGYRPTMDSAEYPFDVPEDVVSPSIIAQIEEVGA